jgi:hypothetical protein
MELRKRKAASYTLQQARPDGEGADVRTALRDPRGVVKLRLRLTRLIPYVQDVSEASAHVGLHRGGRFVCKQIPAEGLRLGVTPLQETQDEEVVAHGGAHGLTPR